MCTLLWPCKYYSQLSLEQLHDFIFLYNFLSFLKFMLASVFSFAWFSIYLSLIHCLVLRLMCTFPLTVLKHDYFLSSSGDIYPRSFSHSSVLTVGFLGLQQLIYICLVYNSLDWKFLSPKNFEDVALCFLPFTVAFVKSSAF